MIVEYNGKLIELDYSEGLDGMLELLCICGHKLKDHSYTHGYGTMRKWITSQCLRCGFTQKDEEHPQGFVCEQFRMEQGKNDARHFNFPGLQI